MLNERSHMMHMLLTRYMRFRSTECMQNSCKLSIIEDVHRYHVRLSTKKAHGAVYQGMEMMLLAINIYTCIECKVLSTELEHRNRGPIVPVN